MSEARKIVHIDMDAFYASVEQRDHPQLRGKPVIVGGQPGKRGVVAAASYEARRFGIHSAMPSSQAYRRCPQAIFVRPRFETYRGVSTQIRQIFSQYTDLVEPLSLDEAYLDVTFNKKNIPSATWVAEEIRRRIWAKTQLTASAGVAPNKFLAKIASDINKPNGIYIITPANAAAFIEQLPIGKFYGIGKATEEKMKRLGISTGADLKSWTEENLIQQFGKMGRHFHQIAHGQDDRRVSPNRIRKSLSVEETFYNDLETLPQMEAELDLIAKELETRLAKAKVRGKTLVLKLRYANFDTITRSQSQAAYLREAGEIARIAKGLLRQTEAQYKPVRLLGIGLANLDTGQQQASPVQLPLPFGDDFWF